MAMFGNNVSVFFVVDDFFACGWYRCNVPGIGLRKRGYEIDLAGQLSPDVVAHFDVIVFQRQWQPAAVEMMHHAKALGKTTVYELDDDLWNLHETNPARQAWAEPKTIGAAEEMLRMADVVTTTTAPLAKQLRRFNPNVRILPNMLPADAWQAKRERPEGYDKVVIGWAGSASRFRDLSLVKHAVENILDRYPQTELAIATGDDANLVFKPSPRVRKIEVVPIEQYVETLVQFDIGIAPVVDSRFNQAKSDLKFLEYSMAGIPTVASAVESYIHSIENGVDGFLAKNDKDWMKYLGRLIENPELRESMGAEAKTLAEASTIERNVWLWEQAYGMLGAPK